MNNRMIGMTVALALGAVLASGLQAKAEEPFCALRVGWNTAEPKFWPQMREALAKNAKAYDEVWFSTGITFPKMEWHERYAEYCKAAAADLRRIGIEPSVELQTVIGHTDYDVETGDHSGKNWLQTMVSCEGKAAKHIACPRDANVRAYFTRVVELHAVYRPAYFWVDDDCSYRNRAPISKPSLQLPGCFCDNCLRGFREAEGRDWERSELAAAIRRDPEVRRRWDLYAGEGYAGLMQTLGEAIHRISPETRMGYQFGGNLNPVIPQGMFRGTRHPARLRPGASAYWDTDPLEQLDKAYELQRILGPVHGAEWLGGICPEIETCPRTFASRTPQGIILEAFENLALGCDFISMFAADYGRVNEKIDFYADRLFPRIAAAHDFLKAYRDLNVGTVPCGCTVKGDRPLRLVANRGVPVIGAWGKSLGELISPSTIKIRPLALENGSDGIAGDPEAVRRAREVRAMQTASAWGLQDFARRVDESTGGKLPILMDEASFAFVMPRVKDDLTLVTVAFVNCSVDRQEPMGVRLRGVPADVKLAVWYAQEELPIRLPIVRDGEFARVTLPRLEAWKCGYLSVAEVQ